MAEHVAIEKHACVACGAQAEWSPKKQALVCAYCGTEAPAEVDRDTGDVREIELVRTLREMPEELRGWKANKRSVRCRSCKAVSVFDPEHVGQDCDFCGSPELVDYDEIKSPIRPQSVLPFKVPVARIREGMRSWYARKWFAPNALKKRARVDTVRGLYIPYWTFDAQAFCSWTAESGTYYYTTETYRGRDGRTRTRQVRHVRWTPVRGIIEHRFDDEPVAGTRGIDPALLREVEPFPADGLVPYDTAYLSGFVIEHYQVVLFDAHRQARGQMDEQLRMLCAHEVPGETHRDLQIEPEYSGQTFKHMLVPVWLLTYRFRSKPYQVIANGYTGKVAGRYPKSMWKILGLVALSGLLAVTVALVAYFTQ